MRGCVYSFFPIYNFATASTYSAYYLRFSTAEEDFKLRNALPGPLSISRLSEQVRPPIHYLTHNIDMTHGHRNSPFKLPQIISSWTKNWQFTKQKQDRQRLQHKTQYSPWTNSDSWLPATDRRNEAVWPDCTAGLNLVQPALSWNRLVCLAGFCWYYCRMTSPETSFLYHKPPGAIVNILQRCSHLEVNVPVVCSYVQPLEGQSVLSVLRDWDNTGIINKCFQPRAGREAWWESASAGVYVVLLFLVPINLHQMHLWTLAL